MQRGFSLLALAAMFAIPVSPANAAFPEKDISFVIPYSAGGGFDRTVRLIAPFMEKHLPAKVNVVAKNITGAAGRKGAAAVYRAKPDGYTIGIFNMPGMAIPAVMGQKVGYDLNKVTWLGRIEVAYYQVVVGGKSNINSIADMQSLDRPIKFLTAGPGATVDAAIRMISSAFDFKVAYIGGYRGARNFLLGVVRGDGDATIGVVQTAQKFVQAGDLKVIATFEPKSSTPGVKTMAELGHPEFTGMGVERLVGGPPNMDSAARAALDTALAKALQDPDYIAAVKKSKRDIAPLGAEGAKGVVAKSMAFYEKYKPLLGKK